MPDPTSEVIRHALATARRNGYSEVQLEAGDSSFEATLEPMAHRAIPSAAGPGETATAPDSADITATLVGYYEPANPPLAVGQTVAKGGLVAVITALGLANDVEASVAGEVIEVLVAKGDAVMYGQPLARVRVPV
jgi:biotin carboxyl carrier protein